MEMLGNRAPAHNFAIVSIAIENVSSKHGFFFLAESKGSVVSLIVRGRGFRFLFC